MISGWLLGEVVVGLWWWERLRLLELIWTWILALILNARLRRWRTWICCLEVRMLIGMLLLLLLLVLLRLVEVFRHGYPNCRILLGVGHTASSRCVVGILCEGDGHFLRSHILAL